MRTFIISSLAIPLFMFAISQKSQAVEPSQEEQMAFLEQSLNEIQTNWTKQIEDKLKKNPVDIQPDGDYVGFYSLEQKLEADRESFSKMLAKSSLNKDQKSKLTDSFNAAVFKVLLYDQNEWKLKDSFKKDWRLSGRAGENVFNYPDFHLSSDFLKKNPKDLEKLLIVDSMEPSKGTSFTTLLNELQAVFEEPRKYCWEQAQAYTCTALGITDHCTWYQDETHGNPREFKLGQLPGSNTKKENYFKNLSLKYPKVSPEIFQNMSDAMMKFCARATMVEIYDKDLLQTTARISKVDEPIMANSPILEQRVRAAGEKLRDESSSQKNSCSYNAITHVQCKDFDIPSFEKNSSFYQPSEVPSKYSEPQKSDKQKRKKARGIS